MAVERRPIQPQIVSQRIERSALREQMLYGAHISVVGAPLEQRNSILIGECRGAAFAEELKDEIRAPFGYFFQECHIRAL
jgi:hypothetical protein